MTDNVKEKNTKRGFTQQSISFSLHYHTHILKMHKASLGEYLEWKNDRFMGSEGPFSWAHDLDLFPWAAQDIKTFGEGQTSLALFIILNFQSIHIGV